MASNKKKKYGKLYKDHCLKCGESCVSYETFKKRIDSGMKILKAVTMPKQSERVKVAKNIQSDVKKTVDKESPNNNEASTKSRIADNSEKLKASKTFENEKTTINLYMEIKFNKIVKSLEGIAVLICLDILFECYKYLALQLGR